jgi:hypothetical protein
MKIAVSRTVTLGGQTHTVRVATELPARVFATPRAEAAAACEAARQLFSTLDWPEPSSNAHAIPLTP